MEKEQRQRDRWRDVVFGSVVLLVVLADQLTKMWIRANLAFGQSLGDVGFFQILHVQNTGAAFGIFKGYNLVFIIFIFIFIIAILLLLFVFYNRWSFYDGMLVRAGMGLVMGGMIGNLIDRLRIGHVTDFLDFKVWPAFNIADSSGVVGAIIIICYIIFLAIKARHQE